MDARRLARRLVALLAALLATASPSGRARAADEIPRRTTGLALTPAQLVVSVGLQDLFAPEDRDRLTSGFVTRVLVRVALQEEGSSEPVALAFQRAEIVYDIWDERFRIRVTRGAGPELRVEARTADEAISRAATLWQLPLAEAARLRPGATYVVAFRGDLNPISEELMTDVRRWLVQPARGQRRVGTGDTFFGSFVSIFVNPRLEDSERQLRFLSQRFDVRQVRVTREKR
ncbi:MAG TPA: DUF4390 domain-containing protein [Polyangia bacterium]|nr:DUF4390 domain-containing protein [Polyangia bacterium]